MAEFDPDSPEKLGQRSGVEEKLVQKKRYQKPSFRWEKVFETQALSCGKVSSTQEQCRHNRKAS